MKRISAIATPDRQYTIHNLMCGFVSLSYDGDSLVGLLYLPARHCCDMRACVQLFKQIDPDVKRIETFSGCEPDTIYQKNGEEWLAFMPEWLRK